MLPLALARDLKSAGLVWKPAYNDFFAIPDSDLDDRVFVLTDMMAAQTLLRGWPAITFHGTSEWAMDYILLHEVVWMPSEEQLRQELVQALDRAEPETVMTLALQRDGRYDLLITLHQQALTFSAPSAAEAYGQALLYALRHVAD
ncbi:MAG: hypothetical protein KC441_17290 [Anaerolineales bacterium]|nr:hypothetical protein [Anaerolineales bacterium]